MYYSYIFILVLIVIFKRYAILFYPSLPLLLMWRVYCMVCSHVTCALYSNASSVSMALVTVYGEPILLVKLVAQHKDKHSRDMFHYLCITIVYYILLSHTCVCRFATIGARVQKIIILLQQRTTFFSICHRYILMST